MKGRFFAWTRRRRPAAAVLIAAVLWLWAAVPADASLLVNLGYAYLRLLQVGDVVHHDLHIRLAPEEYAAYFTDDVTIRTSKATDALYMILGVDYAIDRVTTPDGRDLPFRRHISLGALPFVVYRVDLPARVAKDQLTTVRFHYHISPDTAQLAFPYLTNELFFTLVAMLWYPQMPTEGFFTATVHLDAAPAGLVMVAEGAPVEGTDGRTWSTVKPVPGIGLAVGPFAAQHERVGGRDVYAWHVSGEPGRAVQMARRTGEAVAYLEQLLGPLPLERLDVVALPWGLGGSTGQYSWFIYDEMNGEIPLDDDAMLTYMAAHEAAHKWIGFTAGMQLLGSTWITEGLTDYLAFLTVEHLLGTDALRRVIETRAVQPLAAFAGRMPALSDIDLTDGHAPVAYQKGALVFRALHRRLGDERFFALLRTFLDEYRHVHATPNNFTALIERVGGNDVRRFVSDWVNGTSELDYALQDVRVVPEGAGERVSFKVASVGRLVEPGPVEVLVVLADGSTVRLDAQIGATVTQSFPHRVVRIIVDPDYWTPDWRRENNRWEA